MYTGTIAALPIGQTGYNADQNVSQVALTDLIQALNITYEFGTIQKEGGSALYTPTPLSGTPTVLGGHDWWPVPDVQRSIIFTSAGAMLKDSSGGSYATSLRTGLATTIGAHTIIPIFVEAGKEAAAQNRKLFCFTGANQVQVLSADGLTVADISKPAADWSGTSNFPTTATVHIGRVWAAGNQNAPHTVYYSNPADHEDYQDVTHSGVFNVFPGEGEKIVSITSFKQQILVFKFPTGIYAIDTTDPTPTNWTCSRISQGLGGCGPGCFAPVDDDILFMDGIGNVHMLSTVREYGDYGLLSVSDTKWMLNYVRNNINLAALLAAQAVFYPAKREARYTLPGLGSTVNNRGMTIDFNVPGSVRFRYSDKDIAQSIWLYKDADFIPRPMSGDNAGRVWKQDQQGNKSVNGVGYASIFQTPHYDMSHLNPQYGTLEKAFDFLEIVVEPTGNYNLFCDTYLDGVYKETVQFNLGFTGVGLGTFTLGTDILGGDQILNRKRRLTGVGRRISFVFYNSGAGQDFSISKIYVHFRPGTERIP